jgi:hypothetical protein
MAQSPLGRARETTSQPLRSGGLTSVKPSGVAQQHLTALTQVVGQQKKKRKAMQAALASGPTQNGTGW